ncbi:YncE family protein, partial [Methylobacterium trifolii]
MKGRRLVRAGLGLAAGCLILCGGAAAQEAFVTTQLGNAVDVIDLASAKVVASIPVDGAPAGIAIAPDRR